MAIGGLVPRDLIDLQLDLPDADSVVVERLDGRRVELRRDLAATDLDPSALTLVEAMPPGVRECNNHCEFCFIRGLPVGLRQSLYVFDDDYRYSFVWGNFLTLTNLDAADWARIGYQRLSPLNVSVHATDVDVRRKMLNNRHSPPILPQLERLKSLGIQVNAQVVLCAGLNDGDVLERTIADLAGLYPGVGSLSIVPVGLTRYSRVSQHIRRPTPAEAACAVEQCERWQATLRARLGIGFVYASDELYVLAGRDDVPPAAAYDDFPVLTNGVGLLRSMLDEWQRLLDSCRQALEATGGASPGSPVGSPRRRSNAWPLPGRRTPAGSRESSSSTTPISARTSPRPGCSSGADLIRALHALGADVHDVVLPSGPFGFDGRATLDGVSAEDVGSAHSARVHLASTPQELLAILRDL